VGIDIGAGTWNAPGETNRLHLGKLSGFSGELSDILANDFGAPR